MGRQENTKVVNSCFDLRQETLSSILFEIEGHTITSQLLEMWPDGNGLYLQTIAMGSLKLSTSIIELLRGRKKPSWRRQKLGDKRRVPITQQENHLGSPLGKFLSNQNDLEKPPHPLTYNYHTKHLWPTFR
ncbi:hypothetical protein NC651_038167 [Populus alba x Populus x berolinensis]|nr:hypothetical protein NC651_038167 [Populus alba x Populus x berolinensis]